jgi:hypothetical protein
MFVIRATWDRAAINFSSAGLIPLPPPHDLLFHNRDAR